MRLYPVLASGLLAWLTACAGSSAPVSPSAANTSVSLPWSAAYVGIAHDVCTIPTQCLRGPAYNFNVPVSQPGNTSSFSIASSNPAVATGVIVMTGPGGAGDPAVGLDPHKAGTATLTITGNNGASAQLPVTVTTISSMTVTLKGIPNAVGLSFTVSAPPSAACPSFEGGYSFDFGLTTTSSSGMQDFPAMGTGPLADCMFSTVSVIVRDANYAQLAQKTVQLPIVVGKDNPSTITIP